MNSFDEERIKNSHHKRGKIEASQLINMSDNTVT
jgi:hypothetical protein